MSAFIMLCNKPIYKTYIDLFLFSSTQEQTIKKNKETSSLKLNFSKALISKHLFDKIHKANEI